MFAVRIGRFIVSGIVIDALVAVSERMRLEFWFTAAMICSRVAPSGNTCGAGGPADANGLNTSGRWQLAPEPANSATAAINQAKDVAADNFTVSSLFGFRDRLGA
jgi:hypothetical protein